MYTANPLNLAKPIIATQALGAKLPPAVLDAYERADRIVAASERLHPGQEALSLTVTAALDAGHDPATDPEVQRVYLAQALGNGDMSKHVGSIVGEQTRAVFRDHANAIVKAWRKPFNAAAATIDTCHARIGNVPLEDTATIMRHGENVAAVWAQAKDAVRVVDTIAAAWVNLANLTRFAPADANRTLLRIADVPLDTWRQLDLHKRDSTVDIRKRPTAWDVPLNGLTLDLADGPEYARRVAVVTAPELTERGNAPQAATFVGAA